MSDRTHRDFSDEDIKKIVDAFEAYQNGTLEDVEGFCCVKTISEIEKQQFILTPGRYIGIEEEVDEEPVDE